MACRVSGAQSQALQQRQEQQLACSSGRFRWRQSLAAPSPPALMHELFAVIVTPVVFKASDH